MPRVPRPLSLEDLARALEHPGSAAPAVEVRKGAFVVRGVAALDEAGSGDLSFVRSAAQAKAAAASGAGALVAPTGFDTRGRPALHSARPELVFARALQLLFDDPSPPAGVADSASLAASAHVEATAFIGDGASIGAGVRIGARTRIHANVAIYEQVEIGEDCEIHAGCVIREGTRIGDRVRLQPQVVLGGDGFGLLADERGVPLPMPQVGCVVVEDDVEIGAGTTVDRATLGETRIRRGAKIDNLVMIAHNCDIGEGAIIVGQSGVSGSTVVGRRAILMAQSGTAGHLRIGDGAFLGARAGVHKDVPEGARVWGWPGAPERDWHRRMRALARLPALLRRVRAIERVLGLRGER